MKALCNLLKIICIVMVILSPTSAFATTAGEYEFTVGDANVFKVGERNVLVSFVTSFFKSKDSLH
jgi:hypothetical protein